MIFKLGLTGGIGSGKSTVAAMLATQGAYLVDADALSRQATASGGAAIAEIIQVFGAELIATDGSMNRDAMRALIFKNPEAKEKLEAIVHPLVKREMVHQVQIANAQAYPLVVLDIPLLVESPHWRALVDAVLVVDCHPETQIQRVMQRNGFKREQVQAIVDAQAPRAVRLAAADVVVCNEGIDIAALQHHVQQIGLRFGL
jgi:dephospho-CoA kinase